MSIREYCLKKTIKNVHYTQNFNYSILAFDIFDLIGSFMQKFKVSKFRNMGNSTLQIKHRHIYHCYQAYPEHRNGAAAAMNILIDDVDLNLPKRNSPKNQVKANNIYPVKKIHSCSNI